jgi:hypothetical protein
MRTRTRLATHVLVALLLTLAGRAEAKHVRYLGPHPIQNKRGGGYCYIDAPHIHAYGPDRPNLYQQVGDQYMFTGDPTPFGYDGERHTFYGHHPIVTAELPNGPPVYCLLDGPHFHAYAAPETPEYKVKGDVAFYVGPPIAVKPSHVKLVNAEYRPYVDLRPTVTVEPPPEFHAEVVLPGPPQVVVGPAPRVNVEVGAPGVFVAPPAPPSVTVVAPAPPHVVVGVPGPPSVYVGAPAPGAVYVGAPAPGAVYVERRGHGRHGDDDDQGERRGHHDNGKHKGWFK